MKKLLLGTLFLAACGQAAERPEPIRVGAYEVYVLQESAGTNSTGILIDAPAEVVAEGVFPFATNAVLVRKGDHLTLIDTGYGTRLFEHLAALGIAPEDIDEILLTHTHGDHTGGLIRNGKRAFPNATVSVSREEFKVADGEYATFAPVEIDAKTEDGITPIAAYGHTPGHTMFMITSGDEQLLVWGDVAHAMAVQMPHPEVSVTYDTDPDMARTSRMKVLKYVSDKGIPVVGMHIPATKAGEIKKATDTGLSHEGYIFVL